MNYKTGSFISWSVGAMVFLIELHRESCREFMRWSGLPAMGYGLLAAIVVATILSFTKKK
jgi:hypothetical protein